MQINFCVSKGCHAPRSLATRSLAPRSLAPRSPLPYTSSLTRPSGAPWLLTVRSEVQSLYPSAHQPTLPSGTTPWIWTSRARRTIWESSPFSLILGAPVSFVVPTRLPVHCGTVGLVGEKPSAISSFFVCDWCCCSASLPIIAEDAVYMPEEERRLEYILDEEGMIYKGTFKRISATPWHFGQVCKRLSHGCKRVAKYNLYQVQQ